MRTEGRGEDRGRRGGGRGGADGGGVGKMEGQLGRTEGEGWGGSKEVKVLSKASSGQISST